MNTQSENNAQYLEWLGKVDCFTCGTSIERKPGEIRQVCDNCVEELSKEYAKHKTEEIQFI